MTLTPLRLSASSIFYLGLPPAVSRHTSLTAVGKQTHSPSCILHLHPQLLLSVDSILCQVLTDLK